MFPERVLFANRARKPL